MMKKHFLFAAMMVINVIVSAQVKLVVHFDSNKSELKSDDIHKLDSLADFLKKTETYSIIINGYCDNTGNEIKNQVLSDKRAEAVVNYLKAKNVNEKNIAKKGFAATDPIADNITEAGKAKNRRAEILIATNTSVAAAPLKTIQELAPPPTPASPSVEKFSSTSTITDLEVGKTLVLQNLNFEGGTAILLAEAKPTLEFLLKTLKENPSLEVEIGGHVCCANDMPLSVLRAESVYKYLVKKGISASRLTYKGYSRSRPIFEDDRGAAEAKANRRVEITILKK